MKTNWMLWIEGDILFRIRVFGNAATGPAATRQPEKMVID